MYVLVVHTITDVTAKVPFAMMVLHDAIKTKAIPPHLKVAQLLPTSGARSSSLWEGTGVEEVETFVNSLLSEWCINECFAVVEENAYGLHFDKAVAATKEGVGKAVAATTAAAATAVTVVGSQWSAMDERYQIKEKAAMSWGKVIDLASKAKEQSGTATAKAMENQTVAQSVNGLASTFSFLRAKATEVATTVNSKVVSKVQEYNRDEAPEGGESVGSEVAPPEESS
mmetsp:Transcript_41513/g.79345  ORF Transcript_41513/g.79345 Transcript_41513/m.79345 type:complete len:227 (-) Transcript_41513:2504-3184(-)|eukprot:CAMPEP_0114296004 /NCGR_PEP_ID=MMETSP0059-20121206/11077_1 /TAXON_ID=36894 /ORGANISM="Pyramimonas parkeae, Strain CCMP726" /LENGTH=226 /DNA_ID=CAMNT_0001418117 /DNA_START=1969 /DNA_END=2649 /DNA_ORIENTATION=+